MTKKSIADHIVPSESSIIIGCIFALIGVSVCIYGIYRLIMYAISHIHWA